MVAGFTRETIITVGSAGTASALVNGTRVARYTGQTINYGLKAKEGIETTQDVVVGVSAAAAGDLKTAAITLGSNFVGGGKGKGGKVDAPSGQRYGPGAAHKNDPAFSSNQLPQGPHPIKNADGSYNIDAMSRRAAQPKPNKPGGFTHAGHAFDKHASGQRHGANTNNLFPPLRGNPNQRNLDGQYQVDDILTTPGSTTKNLGRGGVDVRAPDGRGARWNADGSFSGLLD